MPNSPKSSEKPPAVEGATDRSPTPFAIGGYVIRSILVPTDLREVSQVGVQFGKALAKQTGARLYLLNVVEKIHDWKNFGYGPVDWAKEDVASIEANRKKLETLKCTLGDECVVCHAEVKSGDPAKEIARAAEALGADLIILTTRNLADVPMRGEPKQSFAESVLRRARRPVLLLPIVDRNELPSSLEPV